MYDINNIEKIIKKHAESLTGPLGVGFIDLQTRKSFFLNGDHLFPTASVFKIFVLAELFNKKYKGEIALSDKHILKEEDKSPGSGVMFQLSAGVDYTLFDYATLMMILSDNTAADFLFKLVGSDNIKKDILLPLNLNSTKVDLSCAQLFEYYCNISPEATINEQLAAYSKNIYRNTDYYRCTPEKNDVTTSKDICKMLEVLYDGKWCSPEISEETLAIMKKCQTNSRIPKYLPKGTVVAHKTGTFDRLSCDCGIVYTDKGNFILSIFYNGNLASEEEYLGINAKGYYGDEVLAHLSEDIYNEFINS